MKTKEQIVRVIDTTNQTASSKILWISLNYTQNINYLFTPRLENISFIKYENIITVSLKNIAFVEYFNVWVSNFIDKITVNDNDEELIYKFNSEVKTLILIGQKEKTISWESARGLFGELLFIKKLIQTNAYNHFQIIDGWHRPEPANHDFDFEDTSFEVKTISRENTTIKITSEYQLEEHNNKKLYLICYRIEKTDSQSIDSLGILYNEVRELLAVNNRSLFEIKCAEDIYLQYLGPELMPLNYKFITIEENKYNVDQVHFPRIKKDAIHKAISKCSYSIDISSLESFKVE